MDPSNLSATFKGACRNPFKFTQSTKEYKLLQSMMENSEVTPAMRPSDVKSMKDDFKKIDTDKFRAQFNKLKDLTGLRTRETFNKDRESDPPEPKKISNAENNRNYDIEEEPEELSETTHCKERSTWIPQYIQGVYEDTVGVKHAAIIVALTGGVASNDSSKLEVSATDNGHTVIVAEEWSEEMTNMDLFYSNVEKGEDETDDDIYLRRFAMIKAVRDKQQTVTLANGVGMKSAFFCKIPFQTDPTTLKHQIFGNEEGSRFLHIDMTERKRLKVNGIIMMSKKTVQTPKTPKLSQY